MKKGTMLLLYTGYTALCLAGCTEMMNGGENSSVYPQYIDENSNAINDYVERESHYPGDDRKPLKKTFSSLKSSLNGHYFHDDDQDGVCDFAQNGGNTWHGPGFTDENSNNIGDFWEVGNAMHNHHDGMKFIDENSNAVNDYMERDTHSGGAHAFIDKAGDGICDLAQNGGNSWHGPEFLDTDGKGICDFWQPGNRGYGRMHHHD